MPTGNEFGAKLNTKEEEELKRLLDISEGVWKKVIQGQVLKNPNFVQDLPGLGYKVEDLEDTFALAHKLIAQFRDLAQARYAGNIIVGFRDNVEAALAESVLYPEQNKSIFYFNQFAGEVKIEAGDMSLFLVNNQANYDFEFRQKISGDVDADFLLSVDRGRPHEQSTFYRLGIFSKGIELVFDLRASQFDNVGEVGVFVIAADGDEEDFDYPVVL